METGISSKKGERNKRIYCFKKILLSKVFVFIIFILTNHTNRATASGSSGWRCWSRDWYTTWCTDGSDAAMTSRERCSGLTWSLFRCPFLFLCLRLCLRLWLSVRLVLGCVCFDSWSIFLSVSFLYTQSSIKKTSFLKERHF